MPFIELDVYDDRLGVLGRTTEDQRNQTLKIFSGPSVDLHYWAMDERQRVGPNASYGERRSFFRAIYAVLPAWGMHRMGRSSTKMPNFDDFAASLEKAWPSIAELWNATLPIGPNEWTALESAYRSIRARESHDQNATQIVSRSKVLAHLLPNLCAPIDRRYTLTFFGVDSIHQNSVKRTADYEWRLFREMHEHFFHRFPTDPRCEGVSSWYGGFGKSPLKIADDLIVANVHKGRTE